jgi:hypothetical protein
MQKNSERSLACTTGILARTLRVAGLRSILGGILLLALLPHPDRAWSATPPTLASVTLQWNRSPSAEVTGYRIYYGALPRSYSNNIALGNVTNTTVANLTIGDTYYFTVVAFNAGGLESTFSNELLYIVPGGTAQLQIRIAANKQAILTVTGKTNHTYEIQATTDLKTWSVIGTVTLGASGSRNYTNTNAGSFSKRFYRTRDTQP